MTPPATLTREQEEWVSMQLADRSAGKSTMSPSSWASRPRWERDWNEFEIARINKEFDRQHRPFFVDCVLSE